MNKEFLTEKDFTVVVNEVELSIGLKVVYRDVFNHKLIEGEIIKMSGNYGDRYCTIRLDEPNSKDCTIIEILKSSFTYMTYP
jgi:hypothetical protein